MTSTSVGGDSGRQPQLVVGSAAGDSQLNRDQVDPGDFLGDGVFHLDPRVDLEEDELLLGDQEFDGGQPVQPDPGAQPGGGLVQVTTQGIRKPLSGSDFDEFLIAPLDAAVTVAERQRMRLVPGRCRHDLHLDVPRAVQQRLGEHRRVAEAELCLGGALAVGVVDLVGAAHLAHAASTAARERLDHDRAVLGGEERADILDAARALGRGQHRHPGRHRSGAGRGLVTDQLEHVGVRPHERVTRSRAGSGELGVLAEESVTRMNQLGTGLLGRRQYRRLVQVARVRPIASSAACTCGLSASSSA